MLVGEFQPENIAGQIKSADLTAAVAEDLVGARTAADNLIDVIRLPAILIASALGAAGDLAFSPRFSASYWACFSSAITARCRMLMS